MSSLLKVCSKCGVQKTSKQFRKDQRLRDGLDSNCKDCRREWYKNNIEYNQNRNRNNYKKNIEYWKHKNHEYYILNKSVLNKKALQRQFLKNIATPSWANFDRIMEYYQDAKELTELTGIQFHVDHIIPLNGKVVCGLHVENNLQILTREENLLKSNKFLPAVERGEKENDC